MKPDELKVEARWTEEGMLKVDITQKEGVVTFYLENNHQLETLIVALENMEDD